MSAFSLYHLVSLCRGAGDFTRMAKDDQGMVVLSNGSTRMLEMALGAAAIASRFDRVLSVEVLKTLKARFTGLSDDNRRLWLRPRR